MGLSILILARVTKLICFAVNIIDAKVQHMIHIGGYTQ